MGLLVEYRQKNETVKAVKVSIYIDYEDPEPEVEYFAKVYKVYRDKISQYIIVDTEEGEIIVRDGDYLIETKFGDLTTLKPKMFECFFDRFTYWEQEAQ
jgi:hypothetical protein